MKRQTTGVCNLSGTSESAVSRRGAHPRASERCDDALGRDHTNAVVVRFCDVRIAYSVAGHVAARDIQSRQRGGATVAAEAALICPRKQRARAAGSLVPHRALRGDEHAVWGVKQTQPRNPLAQIGQRRDAARRGGGRRCQRADPRGRRPLRPRDDGRGGGGGERARAKGHDELRS